MQNGSLLETRRYKPTAYHVAAGKESTEGKEAAAIAVKKKIKKKEEHELVHHLRLRAGQDYRPSDGLLSSRLRGILPPANTRITSLILPTTRHTEAFLLRFRA